MCDAKFNEREVERYVRSCSMRTRATLARRDRPSLAYISPARLVDTPSLSLTDIMAEILDVIEPTSAEKDDSVNGK